MIFFKKDDWMQIWDTYGDWVDKDGNQCGIAVYMIDWSE